MVGGVSSHDPVSVIHVEPRSIRYTTNPNIPSSSRAEAALRHVSPARQQARPPVRVGAGCCSVGPRAESWVGGPLGGCTTVHQRDPRGLPRAARNTDPGPDSRAPMAGSALPLLPRCRLPPGDPFTWGRVCPLISGLQEVDQTPRAGLEPLSPPQTCSPRGPGRGVCTPAPRTPAAPLLLTCFRGRGRSGPRLPGDAPRGCRSHGRPQASACLLCA